MLHSPRARAVATCAALFVGFLALSLAMKPVLLEGRLGGDSRAEHWGSLAALSDAIYSGELPLWTPNERGGNALLSDPQTGVLYPVAWLMALLLPLWKGHPSAMVGYFALHSAIAALGMFLLVRRFGVSRGGALLSSSALILATRWIKARNASWAWPVAWWPWMVLALDRLLEKPTPGRGATLGVLVALSINAGYTPNSAHGILLLVLMLVALALPRLRDARRRGRYAARVFGCLAVGAVVSVPLVLPTVVASAERLPHTKRAEMPRAGLYEGHLRAWQLMRDPFVPPPKRPTVTYLGLVPLALGLAALLGRRSALRWTLLFGVVFFVLLSRGRPGLLLPQLVALVPGFSLWRIPGNYLFVAFFCAIVLCALGAGDLGRARGRRGRWLAPALLGGAALVALAIGWRHDDRMNGAWWAAGIALAGAPLLLWLGGRRRRGSAALLWALLLALLVFDVRHQAAATYDNIAKPFSSARDATLSRFVGRGYRIADDGHVGARFGVRHGTRELIGDASTLELVRARIVRSRATREARLLAASNVRYYAGGNWAKILLQGLKGGARLVAPKVVELPQHAPRAYLSRRVLRVDTPDDALRVLVKHRPASYAVFEKPDLDAAARRALDGVSAPAAPLPAPGGLGAPGVEAGSARLSQPSRSRLVIDVVARAPSVLVVLEQFYPGWRARVDGRAAPILRANYVFSAVVVPAGRHRVELRYAPPRILATLWLFAATVAGLLLWAALAWRRRRLALRRATSTSPRS